VISSLVTSTAEIAVHSPHVTRFPRGRLVLWLVFSALATSLQPALLGQLPRWVFAIWAGWIAVSALLVATLEYLLLPRRRPWLDATQACIDLPVIALLTWYAGAGPYLLAPFLAVPMASAIAWLPKRPATVVVITTECVMLAVIAIIATGGVVPSPLGAFDDAAVPRRFLVMVMVLQAGALAVIAWLQIATVRAARERRERWHRLFDGAPDSIFVLDRAGTVMRMNAAARRIAGIPDSTPAGGYTVPLGAISDRVRAAEQLRRALAGHNVSYEAQTVRADGSMADILVSNAPLVEHGQITGVLSIVHDITDMRRAERERRQMEQSLDQQRHLLQSIVSTVPTYLYLFDLRLRRVTFANDALLHMLGHSLDSLTTVPQADLLSFYHPDDLEGMRHAGHTLRHTSVAKVDLTYRIRSHDGEWRWLNDRITVFERDADGEVTRLLGSASDVTERRRLEADVRQSQKMEAVGTLAGGIAHDFNNILASVIGYAELAMLDAVSDELQADLQQVLTAAARGRQMVQRILAFSRRSGEELHPVDLEPIVSETLRLLLPTLPPGVSIDLHDEEPVPAVLGDPGQLHQVILNLCANAIYAMRDTGGTLTVRLRRSDAFGKQTLRLEVTDTGTGMRPEVLERALNPFFTTKPPQEGTGMGLAMVHGIVTGMGGIFRLESVLRRGTTAIIELPTDIGRPTPGTPQGIVGSVPTGHERVLVVDDEQAVAAFLSNALARFGYRTTTFTSAEAALEHLGNDLEAYDMVLTDMTMPRMSGEDLLREVRRMRPELPVVLCTGYSASMTSERAHELGAAGYLTKPLSVNELALQVRRILDASRTPQVSSRA